ARHIISKPSPQSLSPSHSHILEIHLELSQFTSSDPSPQSSMPSQRQLVRMQCLLLQVNARGEQVAPVGLLLWRSAVMFPPPSLFLISNIALVLVSATYRKSENMK
uniref:Uncharacterized protein n=1 Tax=Labrus bergylta TaxID=56723 RepID=A0A3Q3G4R7_9LABR